MSADKLPKTDSITELARFWDTHDLTNFEDQLEEVSGPVFERDESITIALKRETADAVRQIAESKGFPAAELIQIWIVERIQSSNLDAPSHRKTGRLF
jgi:hypothetical protein